MFGIGTPRKRKNELEEAGVTVMEQPVTVESQEESLTQEQLVTYLRQVNSLLKFITEMDYVKKMLLDVSKQTEMVEGIAASSQQLSASIEDVSDFVQQSNESAKQSLRLVNDAVNGIVDAFKMIEATYESSQHVQETMHKVNEQATKINDIVGLIKGVADQTNLLALNASIEAARAGEHGRGFAVVADEIKKLAESTKEQVAFITEIVSKLTQEIDVADASLNKSNLAFEEGRDGMNKAVTGLETMKTDLDSIANNFMEISANIEEQTAASEEMASAISVINEKSRVISEDTNRTGSSFNDISKIVDDLRRDLIRTSGELDVSTQIELCVSDHLMWRWRVYNMILGFEKLTADQAGNHHQCRLGRWCETIEIEDPDICSALEAMEEPHASLHVLAKEAIKAYNSGDQKKAEQILDELTEASHEVVGHLNAIKRLIRHMNKKT